MKLRIDELTEQLNEIETSNNRELTIQEGHYSKGQPFRKQHIQIRDKIHQIRSKLISQKNLQGSYASFS